MDFGAMRLMISPESCVGCGICESVCHTVNDHTAIRVTPARALAEIDVINGRNPEGTGRG
jgi:ferredoxin-type protein NapG